MPIPLWYVYILYSVSTGKLYTGISLDPQRRLSQHNAGTGAKFTRMGRPWIIVHVEEYESKNKALVREAEIKRFPRQKKLLLAGLAA